MPKTVQVSIEGKVYEFSFPDSFTDEEVARALTQWKAHYGPQPWYEKLGRFVAEGGLGLVEWLGKLLGHIEKGSIPAQLAQAGIYAVPSREGVPTYGEKIAKKAEELKEKIAYYPQSLKGKVAKGLIEEAVPIALTWGPVTWVGESIRALPLFTRTGLLSRVASEALAAAGEGAAYEALRSGEPKDIASGALFGGAVGAGISGLSNLLRRGIQKGGQVASKEVKSEFDRVLEKALRSEAETEEVLKPKEVKQEVFKPKEVKREKKSALVPEIEKIIKPEEEWPVLDMSLGKMKRLQIREYRPFPLMGNKEQLLSYKGYQEILEEGLKGTSRVIDAFMGTGVNSNVIPVLFGKKDIQIIKNEYNPYRYRVYEALKNNAEQFIQSVKRHTKNVLEIYRKLRVKGKIEEVKQAIKAYLKKHFESDPAIYLIAQHVNPINKPINSIDDIGVHIESKTGELRNAKVLEHEIEGRLKKIARLLKEVPHDIRQGDAWELIQKEARSGDLVIFDPDYIREQGRKVAGYGATTEDKELKTFLDKFDRIVLPKSKEGVKFIVTNTWDEDLARALKERGFEVYKVYRRSHGKNIKSELVATNFRRALRSMDTADAFSGVGRRSQEDRARFSELGGSVESAIDYGRRTEGEMAGAGSAGVSDEVRDLQGGRGGRVEKTATQVFPSLSEAVGFHAGPTPYPAFKQAFEALSALRDRLAKEAARRDRYKVASILGYGKEIEKPDIFDPLNYLWGRIANIEALSRRFGKHYPQIKEIEDTMKWVRERMANRWASFVDEAIKKPLDKLSDKSKKRVFTVLYRESFTGYSNSRLLKLLTPEERAVYRRVRRVLRKIWDDVRSSYGEALLRYIEAKPMSKEEKEILTRAVIKVKPEIIPEELRVKHPGFYRHLVRYSEMGFVPFYMPQRRRSGWLVRVIDPETKETVFAIDFKDRAQAYDVMQAINKGDKSVIKDWYRKLGLTPTFDLDKPLRAVAMRIAPHPAEVAEGMTFSKTLAYLHNAATKAKKAKDKNLAQFYLEVAQDLDDFLKSLGWSAHLIKRKNVPGFALEPEEAENRLMAYLYGYGLSRAKKEAMNKAYAAFWDLVRRPDAPRGIEKWLHDYLEYAFGSPESEWSRKGSRWLAVYYLAYNLASALRNATQNFTSGLAAYVRHKIPAKQLLVGLYKVAGKKSMDVAERRALAKAIREGWLEAKVLNEVLTRWRKPTGIVDLSFLPFQFVEAVINRSTHFLGAFDYLYHKQKLPFEEAYKKAIEIMLEGHFWASRYNRSPLERGNIGRLATALQTFTLHYLRLMGHYISEKDWKALVPLLASPVVLGGLQGVPGGDLVIEHVIKPLYRQATGGRELDVDLERLGNAGDLAKYGLIGLVFPTLAQGIGVGFSEDPQRLIGGAIQGLVRNVSRATQKAEEKDYHGALIELLPPALKRIFKAVSYYKEGLQTASGAKVLGPKGKPVKLTKWEALAQALGLGSPRVQQAWDRLRLERELQERRTRVLRQLSNVYRNKGPAEAKEEWRKYMSNIRKKMREAKEKGDLLLYKYWRTMIIRWYDVVDHARMVERPDKFTRRDIVRFVNEVTGMQ